MNRLHFRAPWFFLALCLTVIGTTAHADTTFYSASAWPAVPWTSTPDPTYWLTEAGTPLVTGTCCTNILTDWPSGQTRLAFRNAPSADYSIQTAGVCSL